MVLLIVGVCQSSSHLHTCTYHPLFLHLHISSSHLHIFSSSHLLIFTSSHLHTSSSHLHIFSSSHLLIFTPSQLHISLYSSSLSGHPSSSFAIAMLTADAHGLKPTILWVSSFRDMMGYADPQYDLLLCQKIGESFKFYCTFNAKHDLSQPNFNSLSGPGPRICGVASFECQLMGRSRGIISQHISYNFCIFLSSSIILLSDMG